MVISGPFEMFTWKVDLYINLSKTVTVLCQIREMAVAWSPHCQSRKRVTVCTMCTQTPREGLTLSTHKAGEKINASLHLIPLWAPTSTCLSKCFWLYSSPWASLPLHFPWGRQRCCVSLPQCLWSWLHHSMERLSHGLCAALHTTACGARNEFASGQAFL